MADHFLQPVNNYFCKDEELEDISDEIFLSNSRANSGSVSGSMSTRSTNPFDEQRQTYAEKRREIESRTLESTQKSLGLLYETEEVGKATAEELARQREKLEKSSRQLDEINSMLRFSQRHLNGLKSVFGGLKNYLGGSRETPSTHMTPSSSSGQIYKEATDLDNTSNISSVKPTMSPTESYDNHPISRIRSDSTQYKESQQSTDSKRNNNPFETQLEANLEEMCDNLSRLKYLATDLGTEIVSQNELLEDMTYKTEDVDLKIRKQNKDMNKLLKK